jgi:hypothetical protein
VAIAHIDSIQNRETSLSKHIKLAENIESTGRKGKAYVGSQFTKAIANKP